MICYYNAVGYITDLKRGDYVHKTVKRLFPNAQLRRDWAVDRCYYVDPSRNIGAMLINFVPLVGEQRYEVIISDKGRLWADAHPDLFVALCLAYAQFSRGEE